MERTQTIGNRQTRFKIKKPSMYHVIMHNDDVTTMEFVVKVLQSIFRKSAQEAETLMLKIHHEGSAIAGTYYKDIAMSKMNLAMAWARESGFPLQLTIEEA